MGGVGAPFAAEAGELPRRRLCFHRLPWSHRPVELPEQANRALGVIRGKARSLRFEIRKACEQERWRLKVIYTAESTEAGPPVEVQLGLLWSEDLAGLEELRRRLEAGLGGPLRSSG